MFGGSKGGVVSEIPSNLDAERSVLSAILKGDKEAQHLVFTKLVSGDFYDSANAAIFTASQILYTQSRPISHITVMEQLKECGDWGAVGHSILVKLRDFAYDLQTLAAHASILREKALLRSMLDSIGTFSKSALEASERPTELLGKLAKEASDLAAQDRPHTHTPEEVVQQFMTIMHDRANTQMVTTIDTGFPSINEVFRDLQPQKSYVIAARPACGKTALGINIMCNVDAPVLFFSLEMPCTEILQRAIAYKSGITYEKMDTLQMHDFEQERFTRTCAWYMGRDITINDAHGISLTQLLAEAKRWKQQREGKLCLIIVDYIQLVKADVSRRDRHDLEVAEVAYALKGLAKDLNCVVLSLAQLNRGGETKKKVKGGEESDEFLEPSRNDLKSSGGIEEAADGILMLWHRTKQHGRIWDVQVSVGKNRIGKVDPFELQYEGDLVRFIDKNKG